MNQSAQGDEPAGFDADNLHWDDEVYEQLARLGKALSNPIRIRLLDLLEQGEHTVEELASAATLPVKNTSAQLQQLRASQLVTTRRDGVRVHYRLADPSVSMFLHQFESFAEERLSGLRVELDRLHTYPGSMERVNVDDLHRRINDGTTILIDVRPAAEYARGHLPGAISMPLSDLHRRIDELPEDADIVAYCEGPYCFASARAVRWFLEAGRQATRIEGGLARWVRSGGDLVG
ncbi:ArsR/SmtB family transcription factor [Solicola gregarius]|uniref:Metalloregulator ArsR/SmtB family transcription factor n=1 Tax=Solicola gregarius TaxID=2908642 RepID=A0AA46TGA3_9ACTN|nr:metalloregulator ArsR/SmtB family transcription factor [Solicola gregarius]UYM04309.1 metalloregulator ArsR/SmtB family transcription factor [Solicola gregarius]